ncbi:MULTISPECIES: PAS domain-containing sensor histidine kinase [Roseateles]|uniref:histidine kinase n=1 Tax=Pelomonas aquatica TaxID=431058 RepID=A0ABU1ZBB4_9BURK|nr:MULTISPECIES: ATP-binding protein [Roseateles]MDR7297912.1 two-component system sensor histidine kinase PilS (NtrC family) [Pelomonas aquatica]
MSQGSWFVEAPPAEPAESSAAFERLYRAFLAARAALGLALIGAQLIAALLSTRPAPSTMALSAFYAVAAAALWLLPQLRRGATARSLARISSPHWWSAIGIDLLLFGVLHALDPSGVNYGALFVMPVLMAAVLSPRRLALATAAMATLGLLLAAAWSLLLGVDVGLKTTQAGLVGGGLFAVSLLAGELSARLAREERAARGSLALARQQEQLNRLVIDEMQEGVLVVDRRGRVRAMNPAARTLLGAAGGELSWQLRGRGDWQPLVQALEQAHASGSGAEIDVALPLDSGVTRSLRLRLRFTRQREGSEELCVLFVEDNRALLARTRQEKLAAMGRVSAGIAHEIRNPLAAIAQANALIAEDVAGMRAEELTRMVASNVQRLKRLVDDVTEVAPGVQPDTQTLDVSALVHEICVDWIVVNGLAAGADSRFQLQIEAPELLGLFDAEHLRRVLVNLLDNALRHADDGAGSVRVRLARDGDALALVVRSAGPPVPPDVERHLFEPFFSTRSRGSGLGLYICRELCERHGARIEYRRAPEAAANEFCVRLRAAPSA